MAYIQWLTTILASGREEFSPRGNLCLVVEKNGTAVSRREPIVPIFESSFDLEVRSSQWLADAIDLVVFIGNRLSSAETERSYLTVNRLGGGFVEVRPFHESCEKY